MIEAYARSRLPIALARGALAAAVSLGLTYASLVVVAWLDDAPPPVEHTHALVGETIVPVAPRPEPDPIEDLAVDAPSIEPSTTAPKAEPRLEAPPPRAPAVPGIAPVTAPGSLPLALGTTALPSMGELPSAALDHAAPSEPDEPARATHRPAPEYPAVAQRRGIEGYVTVRLRIDERGRVSDAVVVESQPPNVFDQTALRTVRSYRFAPARRGGRPVATTLQQTIRFELQR